MSRRTWSLRGVVCTVSKVLLGIAMFAVPAVAQEVHASTIKEDNIQKAIFLARFTEFVEWPDVVFETPKFHFTFCVFGGETAFKSALEFQTRAKSMNRKRPNAKIEHYPIDVKYILKPEDTTTCQVLFVSDSQADNYSAVVAAVQTLPVLTVGETDNFIYKGGGMVSLFFEKINSTDAKVHLTLNPAPAKRVNLKLSYYLLSITSTFVDTTPITTTNK